MGRFKESLIEETKFVLDFESILEAIEVNYNLEDSIQYNGQDKLMVVFDDIEELIEIDIIWNVEGPVNALRGVHLSRGFEDAFDLQTRIGDALYSCFRDGFRTIYIHST